MRTLLKRTSSRLEVGLIISCKSSQVFCKTLLLGDALDCCCTHVPSFLPTLCSASCEPLSTELAGRLSCFHLSFVPTPCRSSTRGSWPRSRQPDCSHRPRAYSGFGGVRNCSARCPTGRRVHFISNFQLFLHIKHFRSRHPDRCPGHALTELQIQTAFGFRGIR